MRIKKDKERQASCAFILSCCSSRKARASEASAYENLILNQIRKRVLFDGEIRNGKKE